MSNCGKWTIDIFFCLIFGLTLGASAHEARSAAKAMSVNDAALRWFERIEDPHFEDYLRRIRPGGVSNLYKTEVLADATAGPQVRLTASMRAKLAALAPVLEFHERRRIVEIKVIDLRYAYVGFQARSVLLISDKAINLLSENDLQAVVAHELAHEYFWQEFLDARRNKQFKWMHEIELRCDGIAVITLDRLGIEPACLISALSSIGTFNLHTAPTDPFTHPPMGERVNFIRKVTELVRERKRTSDRLIQVAQAKQN
jgi:Zn-dependent protease with chaperone function